MLPIRWHGQARIWLGRACLVHYVARPSPILAWPCMVKIWHTLAQSQLRRGQAKIWLGRANIYINFDMLSTIENDGLSLKPTSLHNVIQRGRVKQLKHITLNKDDHKYKMKSKYKLKTLKKL